MDPKKIERINELAKKQKECGLTVEEKTEQGELRQEYLKAIRRNIRMQLGTYQAEDFGDKKE